MNETYDTLGIIINKGSQIQQMKDTVVIIVPNEKSNSKEFYESSIFVSLIIPIIIIFVNIIITRYILSKKDKTEIKKINEDIKQLKKSFQPIVLTTIQITQEKLLEDKINALKEIVGFRIKLYSLNQFYVNGVPFIDDVHEYYQTVYEKVSNLMLEEIENIVSEKGYLFPDKIKENMNLILYELNEIHNIQKREYSTQNLEMPDEAKDKIDKLADKFDVVIDEIRKDLHIDDSFIHDFIEKYKIIE